ncbi:hypothetical protein HNY73_002537 [Argiope bruennichi]|uniref:Uncharacterized protein n=1 Tax=Argiope bruennichi TaxID=94029 RepID=A0A8T0FUX0_ARGBR|nr:hypothetical protein HNY73_002537 [Argiope bruennichi]
MYCSKKPRIRALRETEFFESMLEQHFTKYRREMKLLSSIEQEFSFPVFLLQMNDLMRMLAFLVLYASYDPRLVVSYPAPAMFTAVRSILSFLLVSAAASCVHAADSKAKSANEELWHVLVSRGSDVETHKLRVFMITNKKPFAFSIWGCFHFTKSYIFSAIGCLLTYSLLIAQLCNSIKSEKYE